MRNRAEQILNRGDAHQVRRLITEQLPRRGSSRPYLERVYQLLNPAVEAWVALRDARPDDPVDAGQFRAHLDLEALLGAVDDERVPRAARARLRAALESLGLESVHGVGARELAAFRSRNTVVFALIDQAADALLMADHRATFSLQSEV